MTVNKVPRLVKLKPRGGSRKGCPNKTTKALKEAILLATELSGIKIDPLNESGTVAYLVDLADNQKQVFGGLLKAVLPSTLAITGPEGKDLKITFEVIRPQVINTKLENPSQKSPISPGKYLDIEIKT
jgi:hypothetical protein